MARELASSDRVVLLLSVIPYLREHGDTPIDALAEAFGVSPRLMRELFVFLGAAGVPGETGTYQHEDLFDIDWDALEQRDVARLTRVVAVDEAPRFSAAERAALIAGLQALLPVLPGEERAHARSASEKLRSAGTGASGDSASLSVAADGEDHRVAIVAEALERGRRLSFRYRDLRGGETERTVEPLALTQSTGGWYLRAHCLERDAERTFIVHGMRGLEVSGEPATRRGERRPSTPAAGPRSGDVTATIRVREPALARIASFDPRVTGAGEDGWVTAEVDLAHPAVACRLVQAAPGEVVVEAPRAASEAVRAWADRALASGRA